MKRFLSAVLAAALLFCSLPAAFAASDIDRHWAKEYLTELNRIGVINPSASGNYSPDQAIMRWEFMRYINRAFGFTEKASISFSDVSESDIFYETVQTAVKYGYINGVGDGRMDPTGTLTREQAATILGRLHKYTPTADPASLTFSDRSSLSSYSRAYVAEAVANGYISGYTDGSFKPRGNVTRAEIAKILYFFLGSSLRTENGSYTDTDLQNSTSNATVSAPGTLSDMTVPGNLYITEGVGAGRVTLSNVTVQGDIIVGGGDVTLDGVSAASMVVSNPLGLVCKVTCTGNTNIGSTEVLSSATLAENNLSIAAGGLSDVVLNGTNISVTLDAAVWDMEINHAATVLTTGSASINSLTANDQATITGGGSIYSANLNASGCELLMSPDFIELGSGVTAVIAGERVSAEAGISVAPSAIAVDINNTAAIAHSYDFTFNADKNDLLRVTVGGNQLRYGSDYNLLTDKNGIRIYKTYLLTLKTGTYTVNLLFADGSKASIGLAVGDSSVGAVSPSQLTFDKYEQSPNFSNLTATLTLPAGVTLNSIKIGSSMLEVGKDYTFNYSTGLVTLMRDTLSAKSKGSYTVTFIPSRGSSSSCSLTIVDTTPVNTISPSEVDFDPNTNAGGYADLTVTLEAVDGATLRSIHCGGKVLDEGWQYRTSGSTVTINKTAVREFSSNGTTYADFVFNMSSGKNPVLRVNYVPTYALTASVVDDLGLPVQGASVTFSPTDPATGSSAQTLTTNAEGRATVYVKRGSYSVSASHPRFTATVLQTTTVTSGRTVKLTGEILETVQLIVTNRYGAMLSGAVATIGGQSITTGADGTASFSLKHGSYVAQVSCPGYRTQSVTLSVTGSLRERVMME